MVIKGVEPLILEQGVVNIEFCHIHGNFTVEQNNIGLILKRIVVKQLF